MATEQYNILWFDDEHATLEGIKLSASDAGIRLNGFTNREDGMNEINKNASIYDAIILDGLFHTSATAAEKGTDKAFAQTALELNNRAKDLNLEWFILSGQANFQLNSKTIIEVFGNKRVFDKNKDHEVDELWEEIKLAASSRSASKVRNKYPRVFESLSAEYWDEQAQLNLLNILMQLEGNQGQVLNKTLFNELRNVIEYLFRSCNKLGMLHDDCIPSNKVNSTWSSLFLSGQTVNIPSNSMAISCSKAHFPPLVIKMIRFVLDICNNASHTEGDAEGKTDLSISTHQTITQSSYLLQSCCYQVMDVILWFNQYAVNNANYNNNITLWKSTPVTARS
jgi:hypothetical protein